MKKHTKSVSISESTTKRLIYDLSVKYLLARAVHVGVELNLGRILSGQEQTIDQIAQNFLKIEKSNLKRLLAYLAQYQICRFDEAKDTFSANELTQYLSSDHKELNVKKSIWCQQGDLLEYFRENELEFSALSTMDVQLNSEKKEVVINAQSSELIFLYSRFHLVSRALHIAAQLDFSIYLDKNNFLDHEKIISDNNIDSSQLEKLLRILAIIKLCEKKDKKWKFNSTLVSVLGDRDDTIQPALKMVNQAWWNAVGELGYGIKTGQDPFIKANKEKFFEYLQGHEKAQKAFDRGLGCFSKDDDKLVADSIDVDGHKSVVDVAGGFGGLILEILKNDHPSLEEAALFDQPHVITNSSSELKRFTKTGKCKLYGGDFFKHEKSGIPGGKSLYIIKGVLHDFNDEESSCALKNISKAMTKESELLVVERVLRGRANYTSDLLMLALLNGRERTLEDWLSVFKLSGLECFNKSNPKIVGDFSFLFCKKIRKEQAVSEDKIVCDEENTI